MASMSGKVAAVTASTAGIGLACAERLLQSGATVYISSRKTLNVNKTVDHFRAQYGDDRVFGSTCNVGNAKERQNLVEQIKANHGHLDLSLIHI